MLKDIILIKKELEGFEEIEFPYPLKPGIIVKYITAKDDEESFFTGGKFVKMGNEKIYLTNGGPNWTVPIKVRDDECNIQYESRFFIPEKEEEEEIDKETKELHDTIEFQQSVIEKLTDQLKEIELQKKYLQDDKTEYEELLQQNRYHLKDLSIQLREKSTQLSQYENIIQKLSQSHPLMN